MTLEQHMYFGSLPVPVNPQIERIKVLGAIVRKGHGGLSGRRSCESIRLRNAAVGNLINKNKKA